ncbi:phosphoribosyltransferase [archaeon]|nr:phosphoribosyltransferase [archaeon]
MRANKKPATHERVSEDFEAPTWDDIYDMCIELAKKIAASGYQPEAILGIARGGWIPARILSDLLNVTLLTNIRIEFYQEVGMRGKKPVVTQPISYPLLNKRVLIVDDVADTGLSLLVAKEAAIHAGSQEIRIATLYYKPWSKVKPDYYVKETQKWVIFPWERRETVIQLMQHATNEEARMRIVEKLSKAGLPKQLIEQLLTL